VGQHDGAGRDGRHAGRVKQVRCGLDAPQSLADSIRLWKSAATLVPRFDREP
jgi:hypothetical protein